MPLRSGEGTNWFFSRFELEVLEAGELRLAVPVPDGLIAWVGDQKFDMKADTKIPVKPGRIRITVGIDEPARKGRPLAVRIDDQRSTAKVEPLN